jgi:L-amino acid N-acyltransferase YncA
MTLQVRAATLNDADSIAGIHVRSWQSAYTHLFTAEFLGGIDVAHRRERWSMWLTYPPDGFKTFVAEDDGKVIGFAGYGRARDNDVPEGTAELLTIYLEPDRIGTGAGRALMEAVLADMRSLGIAQSMLWVFADNPRTRRFYETAGWRIDDKTQVENIGGVSPQQVRYLIDLA